MGPIEQILESEALVIHLQPILSLQGRVLFGFEALVRGVERDGSLLSPAWLFEEAEAAGLSAELDRKARHLSIHAFAPLWKENPKLLLFVNFESKLIDDFEPGSYLFDGLLRSLGIPYGNIVLEIKEDEVKDTFKLQLFCNHYRSLGFNIALDDFGIGRSSFDRLSIVRPDIIKIDRSLIANIEHNHIHQEIVHTICNMSAKIGALALAEGVETPEEAVYSKYLGATLVQGYWFSRPSIAPLEGEWEPKVEEVKMRCHGMLMQMHQQHERLRSEAEKVCHKLHDVLCTLPRLGEWTEHVDVFLEDYPDIEALYLIDSCARQIGPTLMRCATRAFYEPMCEGCDHSFKDYYTRARESHNGTHLSGNYVSLASGNICCTYAHTVEIEAQTYVLCVDYRR